MSDATISKRQKITGGTGISAKQYDPKNKFQDTKE